MSLNNEILEIGKRARSAALALATMTTEQKNAILEGMAREIEQCRGAIQEANALDLAAGRKTGLPPALLDRLELTDARVEGMVQGLREVAELPDPVGVELSRFERPNGLLIKKVRVPIGVIGIIFESRPNVTADAAALCFKASNAVILRGGKEAIHSNAAIADALQAGGASLGMPKDAIQLIRTTDREAVRELVRMDGYVDLVMPRGGEGLIRAVTEMARVPVIKHYKGVCQTYVDASADLETAYAICENAKCQRPGVCNAMETMLVHKGIAPAFLPEMARRFIEAGVELRGDAAARAAAPEMSEASEDDWAEEYLALILAVRVVDSLEQAIDHINTYGSKHSDAIVATDQDAIETFLAGVDSATVYANASTRFTDGGQFGMGAEIGISTDKLHARGPMGLEELTTYKYVIMGEGQVR